MASPSKVMSASDEPPARWAKAARHCATERETSWAVVGEGARVGAAFVALADPAADFAVGAAPAAERGVLAVAFTLERYPDIDARQHRHAESSMPVLCDLAQNPVERGPCKPST